MITLDVPVSTRSDGRPPVMGWLAVLAVTLGVFVLMTSELLPVGLLTPVGSALEVSEGTAALMVTVPGLVAAGSAPLIAVIAGGFDRRIVLAVLIGLVGAANLASSLATSFTVVLIARFLVGVGVGGFWSIAGGLALRLVPARQVPRATAVIFGGVETASVLGVPTGTFIGDLSGWRTAFAAVGILGLISMTCVVFLLPKLPAQRIIGFGDLPRVVKGNAGVRIGIAMTFLIVAGHFLAYTFVRPILQNDGIGDGEIGVLLLTFGAAGICGNFISGALVATHPRHIITGISVILALAMVTLAVVDVTTLTSGAILIGWGLGYGAVPVTFQTWILKAAPAAVEAASSLYVSTFNLSIACGALAGGLAFNGFTATSVLWIGATLAVLTLPTCRLAGRLPA